jgi:BMFP domain-containing protein YqiC
MITPNVLEQINAFIKQSITNSPMKDVEKNVHSLVMAVLQKFNLVTREEFEIQKKVLQATRLKLEEIEKKLLAKMGDNQADDGSE